MGKFLASLGANWDAKRRLFSTRELKWPICIDRFHLQIDRSCLATKDAPRRFKNRTENQPRSKFVPLNSLLSSFRIN